MIYLHILFFTMYYIQDARWLTGVRDIVFLCPFFALGFQDLKVSIKTEPLWFLNNASEALLLALYLQVPLCAQVLLHK